MAVPLLGLLAFAPAVLAASRALPHAMKLMPSFMASRGFLRELPKMARNALVSEAATKVIAANTGIPEGVLDAAQYAVQGVPTAVKGLATKGLQKLDLKGLAALGMTGAVDATSPDIVISQQQPKGFEGITINPILDSTNNYSPITNRFA